VNRPTLQSVLSGAPQERPQLQKILHAGTVHAFPKIDIYPVYTPNEQYKGPVGYMGNASMNGKMYTAPLSKSPSQAREILINRIMGK
jgi:hypothetical protein